MLSTSRPKLSQNRRQTRLRLEELESRNVLSILGLHGAIVLTISVEPSSHADASLASTVHPSQSMDPDTVAASSAISLREVHGHAATALDVSLGRDLTSHLQVVAQAPQAVQTVYNTVTATIEQTTTTIVQDIEKIVPSSITNPEPLPVVPPVNPGPLPIEPPVSIPPLPVVATPGPGTTSPILPVVTTGLTPLTQPSAGVGPSGAVGATALPPNQAAQVQSAGVADTGGVPIITGTIPTTSAAAGTSGFRVESGGGDEPTPPDWLVPIPRINEETGPSGAGTENNTTPSRTLKALQACDACFARETLKGLSEEDGTPPEAGSPGWLLESGTAVAALALAVGGFEWGVRSDDADQRKRWLVRV